MVGGTRRAHMALQANLAAADKMNAMEATMNTYRCWVSGQKERTLEVVQAATSFAARMRLANKYRLATYDVVAQRADTSTEATK